MSLRTPLRSLARRLIRSSPTAERYARTVRLVRIEVIPFDSSRSLFSRFIWVIFVSLVRSLFCLHCYEIYSHNRFCLHQSRCEAHA